MEQNCNGSLSDEAEVDELLKIQDKSKLKAAILKLIEENKELKSRLYELELKTSYNDFIIDTAPMTSESDQNEVKIKYSESSVDIMKLSDPKEDEQNSAENSKRVKNPCWNCDQDDHSMRDCPAPRNPQKIAANRKEFQSKQPSMNVRYHVDEPQKFGHLKPGLPSDRLRQALGLSSDQLPSYIYRMRELGYPPGWLKEAEICHSNVALFVDQNQALPDHGYDEDGEIAEKEDKIQYDVSKLQTWPGFNVDFDAETYTDETEYYGVGGMKPQHSFQEMAKKMAAKEQKGYVRGEMQDTTTAKTLEIKPAIVQSTEIKSKEEGTPIVQMYSEFKDLPAQDKWMTNTTDHIMFENLPDATGKFEEMRELLKKVRKTRKNT